MRQNNRKYRVLFLGGGTRVTHLESFKRYFDVYSTDTLQLAPTCQVTKKTFLTSNFNSESFKQDLLNIIKNEDIDLIMPASHHSIKPLDKAKDAIEEAGAFPLISNSRAVEISFDKFKTYKFFRENSIPTLEVFNNAFDLFPLFVKPRDGSGSRNCFKVNNKKELDFFLEYIPNPLVQAYSDGQEYTIDVFSDFDGKVISVVPRKRIEARDGEIVKGVTIKDKLLMDCAKMIAEKLHTIGPICIQCFKENDNVYFTEINCRFGGGITLSIKARADIASYIYKLLNGEKLSYKEDWKEGLYFTRAYREFYIKSLEV